MVKLLESDGRLFWKPDFRLPGISQKMSLRQVGQAFSSFFCQIFGIIDDFSKFCSTFGSLQVLGSNNMEVGKSVIS